MPRGISHLPQGICGMPQAFWVGEVRDSLSSRDQSLEWVKGHADILQNEMSDKYAKVVTDPPPPPCTLSA